MKVVINDIKTDNDIWSGDLYIIPRLKERISIDIHGDWKQIHEGIVTEIHHNITEQLIEIDVDLA